MAVAMNLTSSGRWDFEVASPPTATSPPAGPPPATIEQKLEKSCEEASPLPKDVDQNTVPADDAERRVQNDKLLDTG